LPFEGMSSVDDFLNGVSSVVSVFLC